MENNMINNIKIIETKKGFPLLIPNNDCPMEFFEECLIDILKRCDIISPAVLIDKDFHKNHEELLKAENFILEDEEYVVECNLEKLKVPEPKINKEMFLICYKECGLPPFLDVTNHSSGIERLKTEEGLKSLQDKRFNPELWQVLYSNKKPVGMILCKIEQDGVGRILFIAVIDDFRKSGLGTFLHKKALFTLSENGATLYRGGTSCQNRAMLKIFKKNKCPIVSTRCLYTRQMK
jgi:ribosomal protein S18 acetylase RimI-like enzyme